MEDRRGGRRSGEVPQRRERRRAERHGAPPPRAPRRPRAVADSGSRPRNMQQQPNPARKKPQRRSVRSVLAEAREFTPCLGINPAMLHRANLSKYTGVHHCCPRCTPSSKMKYSENIQGVCGLIDILQVDRRQCRRFPYRLAPALSFVTRQPIPYHMRDHRKDTLSSARVQEAIRECAHATATDGDPAALSSAEKEQRKRAASIIGAMSSAVCMPLIRLVGLLFFWTFGKLFGRMDIQQAHIRMMVQAQKRGVPMVFLPSHKSHMDYLIMTFVLFSIGVKIPRVAGGDNLRLPLVSWLVTRLGGFFIKRKLDSSDGKDVLYRKCLHEYMLCLLHAGENLEFFPEGSRSRSGKPCCPKAGLLSVVVDAVKEGVVEDVLLVPVNISYDRLLERRFVKDELMGGVKKPETVMEALRGAWSILTRKVGAVRVDIAQPFSLQEYLSSAVIAKGSLLELSRSSHRGSISNLSNHSHRKLVTALSYHIMYDITQCSSFSPTGMVAFLLLNKYREHGATVDELVASYLQLERLAEIHGRVIGSSCAAGEAVHYALHHIFNLVTIDNVPYQQPLNGIVTSGNQKIRPCLELPDVFDLYHLSNQVAPLVIKQAVVARSIMSVAREVKGSSKNISRDKVIQLASFLAQILSREFIITPPCEELALALQDSLDSFINCEILKTVRSGCRSNKRVSYLDEEDWETDYAPTVEYQLSSQAGSWSHLGLFSSVLDPLVEAYWLAATQLLLGLPHTPTNYPTEAELVTQFQTVAKAKAQKGQLSRVESCSSDTLRNAVKILQDLEVLVPVQNGDNGTAQSKTLRVANSNHLVDIIKQLTLFRI